MIIDRERLYDLYMAEVNRIAENCDWKSTFDAKDCVNIMANILEENPSLLLEFPPKNNTFYD